MRATTRERGATLIIALGILVLLSVFALAFFNVVNIERQASAYRTDATRADLAAKAGVERALAELRRVAAERPYSDPWTDGWGYRRTAPAGFDLAGRPVDLLTTADPSFKQTDPSLTQYGNALVCSGILGRQGNSVLLYRLKVIDTAAQVNLNHPSQAAAERMLATLLRSALGTSQADAEQAAARVLGGRPAGGFTTKEELYLPLAAEGVTEEEWKRLQDEITVHSWVDASVIRPLALDGDVRQELPTLPRAPINLNTASVHALTALFAGVRAENDLGEFAIDYDAARAIAEAIVARRGEPPFGTSPFDPFTSWPELEAFVDGLPPSVFQTASWTAPAGGLPAGGLYQSLIQNDVGHRDLVKAVLNPNTQLNEFGALPNRGGFDGAVPRLVDKADLVDMTTEGCFDAMGRFEISSLGVLLVEDPKSDEGLKVWAAATRQAVAQVYRVYRLTTQDDFERHRATQIPGNFIPSDDTSWNYGQLLGLNKPVYFDRPDMPLPGWPGLVSWPNYSLARADDAWRTMRAPHGPATWDGSLTLTNQIGTKMAAPDFNVGFSRDRLEAVKGRAYFDPKDELPNGTWRTPSPSHPANPGELQAQTEPLSGVSDADPDSVQSPRTRSKSGFGSVIDDAPPPPGGTTTAPSGDLFDDGSSLWNTGVAIGPDRTNVGGQPQFLAYDSNNLDLTRGTSIRFWVQPLADPFERSEEVLLSFVGSQDGQERQVGFRVYKEALPTGVVNIVLEAVGGTSPEDSGVPVDWNWASATGGAPNRIQVEVTPAAPYANDPLRPQWIPNTWHWVAINIGPGKLGFDDFTQYFATLQVDKKRAASPLFYKGNLDMPGASIHEYGELYGHVVGGNSFMQPLNAQSVTAPGARGWIGPRQLGDYYHCQAGRTVETITKTRSYGGPGNPAVVFQGDPIPFYPWIQAGSTPGSYVPGPAWPSPLPFPQLSYNHRITMQFMDPSGAVQTTLAMVRDASGVFTMSFPAARGPVFGPDGPVNRPTFQTPTGQVVPAQTVTGGYPGGAEWTIGLQVQWDEDHYLNSTCPHCVRPGNTYPGDLTQLPSVEDDPYAPRFGEDLPYPVHDSGPTMKCGFPFTTSPFTSFRSWVRVEGPIPHPQGREPFFPSGPPFGQIPLTYLNDDCHGCEDCDVDGPIFIGGEPGGSQNYAGGGLAPVDPGTMAEAVFDNIVFVNGDEARRTDWPGANRVNSTGVTDPVTDEVVDFSDPAKDFEDRFYEYNLASTVESGGGTSGYGAIYHRGLLELIGTDGALGTITWTSYPTQSGLEFEVGAWRVQDDTTGTSPGWSANNAGLLADPLTPDTGWSSAADDGIVFAGPNDASLGIEGSSAYYDARGAQRDLLVVGIRLRDLGAERGSGEPIPAPLTESPVFDDLTLTVIPRSPRIITASSGVLE